MKNTYKLGVVGAGFMSTAIVKGIISSKTLSPSDIVVSDVNQTALNKMTEIGVDVTADNSEIFSRAEFVLFAVKPQNFKDVASGIKETSCKKFISIMAGVKKQRIKDMLGDVKVARCMPNTPCSIGCGAVGIDVSDYKKEDAAFIKSLFCSIASVVEITEDKFGIVTGISGSSPAYFYLFLKGIIEKGVKAGLSYDDAKLLATATMIGAGKMVEKNNDKTLDELILAVCSKGGTTIEAVKVYEKNKIGEITEKAIDACVKRSNELENI